MNTAEILIGILLGLLTGFVSGLIIYIMTKRRERKLEIYYFWLVYLLSAMEKCKVYFPAEALQYISGVGKKDSAWYKAIYQIFDCLNPFEAEDRVFSASEELLAKNVLIALNELGTWAKKNHIK